MADDPLQAYPQDHTRIDVSHEQDLLYWTEELGVDQQTLIETVSQFGDGADDIRKVIRHLKQLMASRIRVWPEN